MSLQDEMELFLSLPIIDNDNPREWWIQHQKDYPQLSIMALDILSIPAMSSEIERVFSSSGLLLTDRRNCLKSDIIEAAECMKSWSTDGPGGACSYPDINTVQEMLHVLRAQNET